MVGTHLSRSTSLNTMPAFFPPSCEEKGKQNSTCIYTINSAFYNYCIVNFTSICRDVFWGVAIRYRV